MHFSKLVQGGSPASGRNLVSVNTGLPGLTRLKVRCSTAHPAAHPTVHNLQVAPRTKVAYKHEQVCAPARRVAVRTSYLNVCIVVFSPSRSLGCLNTPTLLQLSLKRSLNSVQAHMLMRHAPLRANFQAFQTKKDYRVLFAPYPSVTVPVQRQVSTRPHSEPTLCITLYARAIPKPCNSLCKLL